MRYKLEEVVRFIDYRGKTPPKTTYGVPLITAKIIKENVIQPPTEYIAVDYYDEWMRRGIPQKGDVVLTTEAPLGEVAQIKTTDKLAFAQRIIILQGDKDKLDNDFLFYSLQYEPMRERIRARSTGTTVVGIKAAELRQVEIDIPNLNIQREIASLLSALDARIAENKAINHNLEQQAQAIFKSWFVDFEPWGGVMPDGWREGTLAELATITMGQSPDGSSYNEDGDGTVFYQGRAEFGSRFPSRRLFTTQPKRMAEKGDILMSVRAPVGDLNVAFESCCLGRGLAGIKSSNCCQSFILYTMFALKQQLDMFNGEGTVFGSINKNDMANLPVLIPADEVIHQFDELINPMDATIETNYAENCNLQATRDTLLPKLMSGELSVADI